MTTVFANLTMTSKVYHAPLTEAGKALPPGEYVLWAVPVSEQARFAQTYCSQCGREQGPGDSGVSRCADHVTGTQPAHILPAFLGVAKRKLDDLLAKGYRINGFEIERESPDGTVVERGAITVGGMVIWWHPEQASVVQQEPAQIGQGEPVAWTTGIKWHPISHYQSEQVQKLTRKAQPEHGFTIPLYTHPAPQQKPLTDEQIGMAFRKTFPVGSVVFTNGAIEFARAIEAAHGIGEKK